MIAAAELWRANESVRVVERGLAQFDAGAGFDQCVGVAALISDHRRAGAFVRDWTTHFLAALRQHPLGEVPFHHRHSGGFSTVRLLTCGSASLNLLAYERRAAPVQPTSAVFVDRETVEVVVTGTARGLYYGLALGAAEPAIETEPTIWRAGDRIVTTADQSRQFTEVEGALLVLQITRSPAAPSATQEYCLSDGALVRSASGNKDASRDMLALGVLGALHYQPAENTMERVAQDQSREADLRWEAVRQLLTLNPRRGFMVLSALANDPADALVEPSGRLRQQLVAAYPQLREAA